MHNTRFVSRYLAFTFEYQHMPMGINANVREVREDGLVPWDLNLKCAANDIQICKQDTVDTQTKR